MDACSAGKRRYRCKSGGNAAVSSTGDMLQTMELNAHSFLGPNAGN